MNRLLAFFAALTLTAITVSSSCLASSPDNLRFTLKPSTSGAELHLSLRSGNDDHRSSMGNSFAASDLRGLDLATLRFGGNPQVRFSLVREAGRIDAMARSGYRNLDAGAIVQFKALGITPEFIAGFERIGYRGLPVDTLVQLKALKVTPDYVADLRRAGISPPSADQLVKLGAIGFSPQNRR